MSVNSNITASQQNKKNFFSKNVPFIAGVIDTGDQPLLSNITNITANFRSTGYPGARGKFMKKA